MAAINETWHIGGNLEKNTDSNVGTVPYLNEFPTSIETTRSTIDQLDVDERMFAQSSPNMTEDEVPNSSTATPTVEKSQHDTDLTPSTLQPAPKNKTWYDIDQVCRFMIYNMICQDSRVLELQWDHNDKPNSRKLGNHHRYKPTARARKVPPILHLNREAREWALEPKNIGFYYQLVNFANSPKTSEGGVLDTTGSLYLDVSDIVYFGPRTCLRTMVKFVKDMQEQQILLTKIAILGTKGDGKSNCASRDKDRHDWNKDDPITGPSKELCDSRVAIAGGCTIFEVLHGLPEAIAWNDMLPGISTLKEVFFIVPSQLVNMGVGEIVNTIDMREIRYYGLNGVQVAETQNIEAALLDLNEERGIDRCVGPISKWTSEEEEASSFSFVHFAHRRYVNDGRYHDAIIVREKKDLFKILWPEKKGTWLEGLAAKSGCVITLGKDLKGVQVREIGMLGTAKSIKVVEEAVTERIQNWTPPPEKLKKQANSGKRGRKADFI